MRTILDYVNAHGLVGSFRAEENRLICAESGGPFGLGGKSVWVEKRDERWYISTWVPRIYEAMNVDDVARATVEALNAKGPLYEIEKDIQATYSLRELSPREVDEYLSSYKEEESDD